MWLVLIGSVLALLKYFGVDPVAQWSWWWVWSPFGLAVLWWWFADSTGLTARQQMDRQDKRREKRRRQSLEALGLDPRQPRRAGGAYRPAPSPKAVEREAERDEKRRQNEETLSRGSTQFGSEFKATAVQEAGGPPPDSKP